MIVTPVKTKRIRAAKLTIEQVLDKYIGHLDEDSVVAITSKIVSLCEGRVESTKTNLKDLVTSEAELYLEPKGGDYTHAFTVTNSTLLVRAGIDKNSLRGYYILWPKDAQASANQARAFLRKKFGLKNLGVIITDSTSSPLRYGVTGITIAYSGFEPLKKYRSSQANIAGGLAAAAVLTMGEGSERTPIAVLSDLPFIKFRDQNPSPDEIEKLRLTVETDYFAPFLTSVNWQKGHRQK